MDNNKKSTNDVISAMLNSVYGEKAKDIVLENAKKSKRVKNKNVKKEAPEGTFVISNNEGFEMIVSDKTSHIDWREIRGKRMCTVKNSLEEWGAYDFFYFAKNLYYEKYGEEWNLKIGGSSVEINKIRDKLSDFAGFVSNLMVRDYFKFFFTDCIDFYKKKSGFYFSQMKDDRHISYFVDHYDYHASFAAYTTKEKKLEEKINISADEMSKLFRVSSTAMISSYGLVLSMNWLILNKRISMDSALKIVEESCSSMKKRNLLKVIGDATKSYSPYPEWLPFKNIELIHSVKGVISSDDIKFDSEFNDKFNIFRKDSLEKYK